MSTSTARTPTLIQSLQRGLKLVETIKERGPLTAKSMSESTGINLPTAYHLLRTLIHEDYLCRLSDGRYALGSQLVAVAQLEGRARSFRLVRELMFELATETRAHVMIGVIDEGGALLWSTVENAYTPSVNCWPGSRLPLHATAIGKCILARMPVAMRDEHLRNCELHAWTSKTAVVAERLERDLDLGAVARSDQEFMYGVSCVAAELRGMQDLAALGVAYSSTRTSRAQAHIEDALVQTANRISVALAGAKSAHRPRSAYPEAV